MKMAFVPALAAAFAGMLFTAPLAPQENLASNGDVSLDWDISTIFDEPVEDAGQDSTEKVDEPAASTLAASLLKRRGFTFDAAFRFVGGFIPGWDQSPWHFDGDENYSTNPSIKMRASFGLDAQISEAFRVKSSVYFTLPGSSGSAFRFNLDEFFFDYSFYETVFLRAGKFGLVWGISRNYNFTNLISRIPDKKYNRDPFIFRVDIPLGIGGIQLLTLTRADLIGNETPGRKDFAYGGKYNLALPIFDLDVGAFYQEGMDMRGFLSVKTTLWETEFYNEYLGAVDSESWNSFNGAVNFGFMREFFDRKLSVNGEVFYNAENNARWYSPETDLKESDIYSFLEGFNLALNLLFRLGGKGNPRLFVQALYAVDQESARLIPGFRLTPWQHIDLYFAVPMSLGSKDGYYYKHNEDPKNRPFSVAILVTIRGGVRSEHYQ